MRLTLLADLQKNIKGKFSYFQRRLENMDVVEKNNLLIINSYILSDMFNIVCCQGAAREDKITATIHEFRKKSLPFAWWVGFENEPENLKYLLENNGLKKSEEELAMAIELEPSFHFEAPKNLIIEKIDNHKKMQDFVGVITDIVPQEKEAIENFYFRSEEILFEKHTNIEFYIGKIESKPIGTCSVFFSENVAGIFDIIASPSMRGRGIGSAMTRMAMQVASKKGYKICVLTATNDAKYVYEKIGFKPLKSMCVYT